MGGGKKRPSMTQMAKAQTVKERKSQSKGSKTSEPSRGERKSRVVPPNPKDKRVVTQVQSMKVLTPYTVAARFSLVLSVAKDFLEELHRQGTISYVSGGKNLRIYKPSE